MRGLRKYLTPFAPDQSGAVSVLYELGGITVICDAGGCTGNICGFDEPRWHTTRSAVFSAGLRDMDAIMGRDDKLVAELADAATRIDANFAAIIGTPVPSVIGTDYMALRRMAERKLDIPVITIDTTGMELYDIGAEKAYLEIFRRFAKEQHEVVPGRVGVLGVNPLDMSDIYAADKIMEMIPGAVCYGMQPVNCTVAPWNEKTMVGESAIGASGDALAKIANASSADKNIVAAPAAVKAAKLLEERFGTPYEIYDPLAEQILNEAFKVSEINGGRSVIAERSTDIDVHGKRILIVDQQVRANTMRDLLIAKGAAEVNCATWFLQLTELARPGDARLREEDDFETLVKTGDYDIVIGDGTLMRIVPEFGGIAVDVPQFPVSGRLNSDRSNVVKSGIESGTQKSGKPEKTRVGGGADGR